MDELVKRIVRIERLLLAIGTGIMADKMDKGIEYFMIGEDPDQRATFDEVSKLLDAMQADMERSSKTGGL